MALLKYESSGKALILGYGSSDLIAPVKLDNQDNLKFASDYVQFIGWAEVEGSNKYVNAIYYGKFNYANQSKLLKSKISGVYFFASDGSQENSATGEYEWVNDEWFEISGIKGFKVSDFLNSSLGSVESKLLKGNDSITATKFDDKINGKKGNDSIWGGEGNDTLLGEAGNDQLFGGAGIDLLYGGSGKDKIWGGDGGDYIEGGAQNDQLLGEDGNDSIFGDSGNDVMWGGAGDDVIYGGSGKNILYGDDGSDKLFSTNGKKDLLFGGEGADKFIFGAGYKAKSKSKAAIVKDFSKSEGDKIVLDFSLNPIAAPEVTFGSAKKFSGKSGEIIFTGIKEGVMASIDISGNKKKDAVIIISGVSALEVGDIFVSTKLGIYE